MSKTILIAGGTGLVGNRLSEMLVKRGYKVLHLSRKKNLDKKFPAYQWNPKAGTIDETAIQKADAVINLAGAGIVDARWTGKRKKLIISSRTRSTLLLKNAFEKIGKNPDVFISAAATGYYGDRGDEEVTEESDHGQFGFLSESCIAWERALDKVKNTGWRTARIRIGIVLSVRGGALAKMLAPARINIGGYFSTGQQWYSWIHIEDLCRMFIRILEKEKLSGVYNGVAPFPERNKDFMRKVGEAINKPLILISVPEFLMRIIMGESADTVFSSTKVASVRNEKAGFEFQFPKLTVAVKNIVTQGK